MIEERQSKQSKAALYMKQDTTRTPA